MLRQGWIINFSRDDYTCEVLRAGPEAVRLDDGTLIFEAWWYHYELQRWFVMSRSPNVYLQRQGVIYFEPGDLFALKRTILQQARVQGLL